MKIHVHTSSPWEQIAADSLLLFYVQSENAPASDRVLALDKALGGELSAMFEDGELPKKKNEVVHVRSNGRIAAKHLFIVGLGERDKLTPETVRQAAGTVSRSLKGGSAAICLKGEHVGAAVEGILMGLYSFQGYQTDQKEEEKRVRELAVYCDDDVAAAVESARIHAEAVNFARDYVNERANYLDPILFAMRAEAAAKEAGLDVEVFDEEQLEELGMNLLLAVGKGSDIPPRLVVIRYNGAPESAETLALVGKGVTYDTGGYIIKPETGMGDMHTDMAGAACVLGAMRAIAEKKLALNAIGILVLAENMISGRAFKPGDIATAFNGKTVELIDTDCEGRLVLADGIAYAKHLGATRIVDTATLTGAVTVVLGYEAASLYGNDDAFIAEVRDAGFAVGEKLHALPNFPEYQSLIESKVADYINYSGRNAAAIAGGVFLAAFAEDVPFVHIDMASVATVKSSKGFQIAGGTAFSTRTMIELAERLAGRH